MSDIVIEAAELKKTYKDFWGRAKLEAVKGINFTIREGQVFGLLGPNGSGKSTTIKMILGLLFPTGGALRVFGGKPSDVDNKKRIGYLPEETSLYDHLTARETLIYFGSFFKLSKKECLKRSEQLLDMVGLSHAANRPVGEFSKGMARRIGLAQALINDPELIILDEPTSGLDPIGCREVKELIKTLAKRGKTVLVTSHLLADIEDIVDEIAVLYGGTVQASGTIDQLLTINEKTRITFDSLDPDRIQQIIEWLKKESIEDFTIDKPSRGLEEFFLKVVRRASREQIATGGALQKEELAAYLQDDEKEESPKKSSVDTPDQTPKKPAKRETPNKEQEADINETVTDNTLNKITNTTTAIAQASPKEIKNKEQAQEEYSNDQELKSEKSKTYKSDDNEMTAISDKERTKLKENLKKLLDQ